MSVRKISFAVGEYYHVYNRGNSKQEIFHDRQDYERFVGLLYVCNDNQKLRIKSILGEKGFFETEKEKPIISIGAYCLMPNHFHLLITPSEDGDVSLFMQKVSTAYVMYYNKKYSRTGSLFEGKFKSKHASSDEYLKYLFSYIHLNPVGLIDPHWKKIGIQDKNKALEYLSLYHYSSYLDYSLSERKEGKILNRSAFPDYFPEKSLFNKEIFDWISYVPTLQGLAL